MPLQPFKATVPQDGKSWWLRLGKENLPDKFIFTLLLDMQPEHFLHRMQDVQILSQFGEYTVYSGVRRRSDRCFPTGRARASRSNNPSDRTERPFPG